MRCGVCCSGHLSATYRASQTDPVRIALMDDAAQRDAGKGYWRLEDLVSAYSAVAMLPAEPIDCCQAQQ